MVLLSIVVFSCSNDDKSAASFYKDSVPVAEIGQWDNSPYNFSQTFYVRPPGAVYGIGDGSSWENAFSSLPENLIRGAKYYLASGDYDTGPFEEYYEYHSFKDDEVADLYIGIYKATVDDHGTDQGWNSSFGTGSANLGPISFITGYYVIDGQVGSHNSGHGFKLTTNDCANDQAKIIRFSWNSKSHHIVLRHMDMGFCGPMGYLVPYHDVIYGNVPISNIIIQYCYIHDSNRLSFLMSKWNNVLIEKSYIARNGNHQESSGFSIRNSSNIIVRKCFFSDAENTFFSLRGANNVFIYSNIFTSAFDGWATDTWLISSAIENTDGLPAKDIFIYGNTFYKLKGLNSGIRFWNNYNNIQVYNNLWTECITNQIQLSGTHDYNAFYNNWRLDPAYLVDEKIVEDHVQLLSTNPFVDPSSDDFHLNYTTNSGKELPAPFNEDYYDVFRGTDGVWDRGAASFVSK